MATYTVIDADGHVREPVDLWQRYAPAGMADRLPKKEEGDNPYFTIEGVEMPPRRSYSKTTKKLTAWNEDRFAAAAAANYSPASQVDAMDVEGIDVSVVFPSHGLVVMGVDGVNPAVTTATSTAYNTWLAEYCGEEKGRIFGAGMIDPRDVDGAVKEAQRCAELGFLTVYLRPNPVEGRMWHDPAYEPLWSALEELDLPVCFHEGGSARLPQVATDRFVEHAYWHICTHPMEQMMSMVSVVLGGVAERHPSLRFAFLECGAGWLPYWMWRMDESVEGESVDFDYLTLKPSEYVARQCFVSIDTDEDSGRFTLEELDAPRVVWGSDYPHHDGKFPRAIKTLSSLPFMTDELRRKVLHDAPLELFGKRLADQLSS